MVDMTEFDPIRIFNQMCMDKPETHAIFSLDPDVLLGLAEDIESRLDILPGSGSTLLTQVK